MELNSFSGNGQAAFRKPRDASVDKSVKDDKPTFKTPIMPTIPEDEKIRHTKAKFRRRDDERTNPTFQQFKLPSSSLDPEPDPDPGPSSGLSSPPSSPLATNLDTITIPSSPPEPAPSLSPAPSTPDLLHLAPTTATNPPTTCPICSTPLPPALLATLSTAPRRTTREKLLFCTTHRRLDAARRYADAAYPPVDWPGLPARLHRHTPHLAAVLSGAAPSPFRDRLEALVASGAARAEFHRAPVTAVAAGGAGYYGPRGARRILEHVLDVFAGEIRDVAPRTAGVGVTGVAGYVQAVLVPEMAVCLVCEDYECGREEARGILEESAEVGEAMHGEEEERIVGGDLDGEQNMVEEGSEAEVEDVGG